MEKPENTSMASEFEDAIWMLTMAFNGQYPRPWMTNLTNPLNANVFIIGRNQAKTYDASMLSHERHFDALFNRNGEACRKLYEEIASNPSPTRRNIDQLRGALSRRGISDILETNVICYSSAMSSDLALDAHAGGKKKGTEIFATLLQHIKPKVLIVHGTGTSKDLAKLVGYDPKSIDHKADVPATISAQGMTLFFLKSLAPPGWNTWQKSAARQFEILSDMVADTLAARS